MTVATQKHLDQARESHHAQPRQRPASAEEAPFEGLLALLVTDLEGFTTLIERLGDEPGSRLMHRHNVILRACIQAYGGREVTHTGDGVIAAFRSIRAALRAACEIQHAFERHSHAQPDAPLRTRIGIHVGEPVHGDGRLIGTCVNTAVRVCDSARGGRVLVTELVRTLASGLSFPFEPGGTLKLKGLSQAARVYELQWHGVGQPARERC